MEAEAQRDRASGELIGYVGHPGAHRAGGVDLAVALLDPHPVGGVGVVRRPRLVRAGQNAQVDPAAATAARLDPQRRMVRAQTVEDTVEIAHVRGAETVGAVLPVGPAGLAERAVHVPLEEVDAVVADQPGQPAVGPVGDLAAGEVEDR